MKLLRSWTQYFPPKEGRTAASGPPACALPTPPGLQRLWPQLPPELAAEILTYLDGEDWFSLSRLNRSTAAFLRHGANVAAMHSNTAPMLAEAPNNELDPGQQRAALLRLRREVVLQRALRRAPLSLTPPCAPVPNFFAHPVFNADATAVLWLCGASAARHDLVQRALAPAHQANLPPVLRRAAQPDVLVPCTQTLAFALRPQAKLAIVAIDFSEGPSRAPTFLPLLPQGAAHLAIEQQCLCANSELLAVTGMRGQTEITLFDLRHNTRCALPMPAPWRGFVASKMEITADGRYVLLHSSFRQHGCLFAVERKLTTLGATCAQVWEGIEEAAVSLHGRFLFTGARGAAAATVRVMESGRPAFALPPTPQRLARALFVPRSHDLLVLLEQNERVQMVQFGFTAASSSAHEKQCVVLPLRIGPSRLASIVLADNGLRALVHWHEGARHRCVVVGLSR